MNKNVYVFLATGFEEIEAIATIDLLRRAGLSTVIVGVEEPGRCISGAHNVSVCADKHISEISLDNAQAIVLPGGLPGVTNLAASELLIGLVRQAYDAEILIAAICAAPKILGDIGLLNGRKATVYPGFEKYLTGHIPASNGVQIDGNIITATSAGFTLDFALVIIRKLSGENVASEVANSVLYTERM